MSSDRWIHAFGLCLLVGLALAAFQPQAAEACTVPVNPCQVCWDNNCDTCLVSTDGRVVCLGCSAQAPKPQTSPASTRVEWLGENRALVSIYDYRTTVMTQEATNCIVALSPVDGVETVDSVRLVATESGDTLEALAFSADATAGFEFASLAAPGPARAITDFDWQGFLTHVSDDVEEGILSHFELEVTLQEGMSLNDLVAGLERATFGTGGAHHDGTLEAGHEHLRHLRDGGVSAAD